MNARYGIAEWYGESFSNMTAESRRRFAAIALDRDAAKPQCPFQTGQPLCQKAGGVCSIQRYNATDDGRLGEPVDQAVIMCPARFEEQRVVVDWLADIVGFPIEDAMLAREVPFMIGVNTGKPAGMIDLVVARTSNGVISWYGLEVQAVYFSGRGMQIEFEGLLRDGSSTAPFPNAIRRPDWRSSSAKRLMPQLQIKVPTLRRWGSKLAVAVDRPFFNAIGGQSADPSHDLGDGDVIWLVLDHNADHHLQRGHWEVLTLEESSEKLLAADTVRRADFEVVLRDKLEPFLL